MPWYPHNHDDRYVKQSSQAWDRVLDEIDEVVPREDLDTLYAPKDSTAAGLAARPTLTQTNTLYPDKAATEAAIARTASEPVFDASHPSWGIVGDNVADDTAALQAMADACETALGTFYIPAHLTCRISTDLNLRYIRSIQIDGRVVRENNAKVIIGNNSAAVREVLIRINEVSNGDASTGPAIRAVGLKNGKITINKCPYLQLWADSADATMSSIAYTDWDFGKIDTVELLGATSGSWINENRFHGGRVTTLLVGDGTSDYPHNNNRFYDVNLENSTVTFHAGSSNYVRARFEFAATITLAAGTHSNQIVQTYLAAEAAFAPSMTIIDNGVDNQVLTTKQAQARKITVARIDSASRTTDTASAWNAPHATRRIWPGFRKVAIANVFTEFLDTGVFPLGSIIPAPPADGSVSLRQFRLQSDAALWRPRVYVYAANRQPLDGGSGGPYINTAGGWTWVAGSPGYYAHSVDVSGATISFTNPAVAFARIVLVSGNSGAIGSPFRYAELVAHLLDPYGDQLAEMIRRQARRPLYQTGTTPPAKSLLHKGDSIGTDTGRLTLIDRRDTTLSAAATGGATSITVTSATGIASGDTIAVLLDDDTTHFTTVSGAPVGSVVTLTVGLPSAAAIGRDVATQRWLHIVKEMQPALTAPVVGAIDATYDAFEQSVVDNLRTRVNELESRLQTLGLISS